MWRRYEHSDNGGCGRGERCALGSLTMACGSVYIYSALLTPFPALIAVQTELRVEQIQAEQDQTPARRCIAALTDQRAKLLTAHHTHAVPLDLLKPARLPPRRG